MSLLVFIFIEWVKNVFKGFVWNVGMFLCCSLFAFHTLNLFESDSLDTLSGLLTEEGSTCAFCYFMLIRQEKTVLSFLQIFNFY